MSKVMMEMSRKMVHKNCPTGRLYNGNQHRGVYLARGVLLENKSKANMCYLYRNNWVKCCYTIKNIGAHARVQ